MKQYRCANCENSWEAMDEPFECPQCHSADIMEVNRKPSFTESIKRYWWILASAVVVVFLFIILMPKDATCVIVKAYEDIGRMEVVLKGKHSNEYLVVLKQNGSIEQQAFTADSNQVIFMDLRGDYVLELVYQGKGVMPRVRKYKKEYSFYSEGGNYGNEQVIYVGKDSIEVEKTVKPEIIKLIPSPSRIAIGGSYSVTIVLSPYGCSVAEAEFSMDGQNWQNSPKFSNLKPGGHKFMARNKKMNDLISEKSFVLEDAVQSKECLSIEKANSLLPGIAKGDSRSKNEFIKYAPIMTPVKGDDAIPTVYRLLLVLREDEAVDYFITDIECSNGLVESITIKAK